MPSTMIPVDSGLLRTVAQYVGDAQRVAEKQAKLDTTVRQKVAGVVDTLVQNGLLSEHLKEAKLKEITDDPSRLLDFVEKLAARIQVAPVGAPVEKQASRQGAEETADRTFIRTLTGG